MGDIKDFEKLLTSWTATHSILFLRMSLGLVFFWFGALKFVPDLSSAEDLASRTINKLTNDHLSHANSITILATWECLIGVGLIIGKFMRIVLVLLFLQMLGTILPLFFFPTETFIHVPYAPTLEGQYIIKNIVIIAAAMVLLATVRGGAVVADPKIAKEAKKEEEEKLENIKN
jgi:uncharacterized membrane protein YphA (DoxX/SURF4 family)